MHPNPLFRDISPEAALDIARARGFGVLSVNGAEGPLAAHIPFDLGEGELRVHLARSNSIVRAGLPAAALLVVSGPDAYVSPDWYGGEDQVPTWNYIAVHIRGRLEPVPAEEMRPHLERMSEGFETRLAPKRPWKMAKMSDEAVTRMMRMILPFRLVVASVECTAKLNQNKTPEQRAGAAAGIAANPIGMEAASIAAWMSKA